MRVKSLKTFLIENTTTGVSNVLQPEDFAYIVKKECSDILAEYKKNSFNKMLYRGFSSTWFEQPMYELSYPKNRTPKDSTEEYQNFLNTMFDSVGVNARRDNSFFVTNVEDTADSYGKVYIAFPMNGFYYTYSEEITDFYNSENDILMNTIPEIQKAIQLNYLSKGTEEYYSVSQNLLTTWQRSRLDAMTKSEPLKDKLLYFFENIRKYVIPFYKFEAYREYYSDIINYFLEYSKENFIIYSDRLAKYKITNYTHDAFSKEELEYIWNYLSIIRFLYQEGFFERMRKNIIKYPDETTKSYIYNLVSPELFQKYVKIKTEKNSTLSELLSTRTEIHISHPTDTCLFVEDDYFQNYSDLDELTE